MNTFGRALAAAFAAGPLFLLTPSAAQAALDLSAGSNDSIPASTETLELDLYRHFGGIRTDRTWDEALDRPGTRDVFFGVALEGPEPYTRNSDVSFKPASNSKLFTAGAALDRLGPEFRFETRLEWQWLPDTSPGAITGVRLIGSGDPSWGMEEFGETVSSRLETFARQLKERGVRAIHGPIELVAGDHRWKTLRYPEGWTLGDRARCYGALAQAFNNQINCATFVVRGQNLGAWVEYGVPTRVSLELRKGSITALDVAQNEAGLVIRGTWARGSAPATLYLPVSDVVTWQKNLFTRALTEAGIAVLPSITARRSLAQPEADPLIFHSAQLSELLKPFMKLSLNMMGDAFLKAVGERATVAEPDLLVAGREALESFAAGFGIPADELLLRDGSGLSHESRVTPRALLLLLEGLALSPGFPALWDSLPIAGVDGTLANRMRGTPAQGRLRAKTGTLSGSYNLAGYAPRIEADGTVSGLVPFVVLARTTRANATQARAAADRVGARLSSLIAR